MENGGAGDNGLPADELGWAEILNELDAHQIDADDWKDPSQDGVLTHLFEGDFLPPMIVMISGFNAAHSNVR
jgi:hypothetical protein